MRVFVFRGGGGGGGEKGVLIFGFIYPICGVLSFNNIHLYYIKYKDFITYYFHYIH